MIGHVEKAAQGANFVGGPRPISLGENIAEHFKTDPEVTQTSNRAWRLVSCVEKLLCWRIREALADCR
jgi:hypothetical protein